MKTFATYNLKGGVGKTAVTVNLAFLSALAGYRTLVWDLDPQGAASFYFRIKPRVKGGAKKLVKGKIDLDDRIKGTDFDHLDLLPADLSYRYMDLSLGDAKKKPTRQLAKLLKPLSDEYDHLFLDCPPGMSLVSENVFHAADVLLIPLVPTTLSVRTYEQIYRYLDDHPVKRTDVLPFFNMVDRRKKLHREVCEAPPAGPYRFLRQSIPFASVVERMGLRRAPLVSYDNRSAAARAFAGLWDEIQQRMREDG
jgi:chromosome partitioning protein